MVVAPVEAVAESGNYGSFQVAAENEQKEDVSNTKEQESYVNDQYEQPKDESVTEGEVVHEQQEQGYTQVEGGKSKRDYQQQQYVPRGSIFVPPAAEEKYEEISNAYEVLSDDEKISLYNRFGEAEVKGAGGMGGMWDFRNPFDLFESLFEGMGGMGGGGMGIGSRSRAVDGQDEYYTLILNFREAVFGMEKDSRAAGLAKVQVQNHEPNRPNAQR